MNARISLMTVFSGNTPKLKRKIKNFLNEKKIGFVLQTTEFGTCQERLTLLVMEGEKADLYNIRNELVLYLNSQYPTEISSSEWEELVSEVPLLTGIVKKTPNSIDPDSSGNDSPSSNNIAETAVTYENWISGLMNGAYKTLEIVNKAAKVAKSVSDSFKGLDVKNVHVTYGGITVCFDIGQCRFLKDFTNMILKESEFKIPEGQQIAQIYSKLSDNSKSILKELAGFKTDGHYFVETESSLKRSTYKFSEMEDFFKALKEMKGNSAMERVREVLVKEDIDFKQLMETGDLAITDAELKEYGIAQGGLRKAILSLIRSNHK